MISFSNPFKVRREANAAHELYVATIGVARDPWLFNDCGVPDTPEGRFEALTLMAFIVLNRLKDIDGATGVSQAYFDIMFEDIDANLREMGVGEATIAKRMKKLAGSFYGRVKTYDEALTSEDAAQWPETIRRYLFNEVDVSDTVVAAVAAFSSDIVQGVAIQDIDDLLAGKVIFAGQRATINEAS